jgi:hypothetical protein
MGLSLSTKLGGAIFHEDAKAHLQKFIDMHCFLDPTAAESMETLTQCFALYLMSQSNLKTQLWPVLYEPKWDHEHGAYVYDMLVWQFVAQHIISRCCPGRMKIVCGTGAKTAIGIQILSWPMVVQEAWGHLIKLKQIDE